MIAKVQWRLPENSAKLSYTSLRDGEGLPHEPSFRPCGAQQRQTFCRVARVIIDTGLFSLRSSQSSVDLLLDVLYAVYHINLITSEAQHTKEYGWQ